MIRHSLLATCFFYFLQGFDIGHVRGAESPIGHSNLEVNDAITDGSNYSQPKVITDEINSEQIRISSLDLGPQIMLHRVRRPRLFRVFSSSQYVYTSNVLLGDGDFVADDPDVLFFQTFEASLTPRLLEEVNTTIYARYDIARYNDFSQNDYDGNEIGLRLSYRVEDLFAVYGDFSASRQYFRETDHEFLKMLHSRFGLWHSEDLTETVSGYFGYQFDWKAITPSSLTRVDNSLYGGLRVNLFENITVRMRYRIRVREFLQTDRTDFDHLINLTVSYSLNDDIRISVISSYSDNNSDVDSRDYQSFTGGGGLNISTKF